MELLSDDVLFGFADEDAPLWRALELEAQATSSSNDSAPQSLEAWAPPARALRCVDPAHPADCSRCTSAPHPREAPRFELTGDPGRKNGEKKLRSMLTRTPEWASSDERDAAAHALRPVLPRLAEALHARASYMLSKQLLLALLGYWGYRSDAWRRRGNRTRPQAVVPTPVLRAAPRPSYELADFGASHALHTPHAPLQLDAAWLHLRARIQPLVCEAERLMLGPGARAVARRGDLATRAFVLAELRRAQEHATEISQLKVPRFASLLAEARALQAAQPAACVTLPAPVLQLEAMLTQYARLCVDMVQDASARIAAASGGGALPLELVTMSEELSTAHIFRDVVDRIVELLSRERGRSTAMYAGCAALCGEMLVSHMVTAIGVYTQRAAWLAALGHGEADGAADVPLRAGCCGAAGRCEEVNEQAVVV